MFKSFAGSLSILPKAAPMLVICGLLVAACSGGGLGGLGSDSNSPTAASVNSSGGAVPLDQTAVEGTDSLANVYNEGLEYLSKGNFKRASAKFAEVERQFPYSQWATRAILMQAYVKYQSNSYDDAINASQRFIRLHPGHQDVPYAYYLIAISNYERIIDIKRDQSTTQKALEGLEEVARRFPQTPYARDANAKAIVARDHLAGKEMEVGRYYARRKDHVAAINRYKTVVEKYQTTSHTPEALYRLTEQYLLLGVQSEAQTAAAILGYNYPDSEWYKDAYALLNEQGLSPTRQAGSAIGNVFRRITPF